MVVLNPHSASHLCPSTVLLALESAKQCFGDPVAWFKGLREAFLTPRGLPKRCENATFRAKC